jgi:hypothetical protein
MTRVRARVVTVALVAVLAAVPATALAKHSAYPDTPKGALNDCGNGNYPMKGHYTIKVLQQALKEIVAYKLQYTNCATILKDTIDKLELTARRQASGGGTSNPHSGLGTQGTHGGHSSGANPIGNKLQKLKTGGGSPVLLPGSGQTVTPGTVAARGSSFLSNLPTPLLIVIAVLLATVLAVGARAINNLVRTQRPN